MNKSADKTHARMPTLFIGHGAPTNALGGTSYSENLRKLGEALPRPAAIVVVSAHWRTRGTKILAASRPQTIHDFGNFGPELLAMQYPAPGAPEVAREIQRLLALEGAELTEDWGLDHGAWTVLRHLYPQADIPTLQLSLNQKLRLREHYELAQKMLPLRDQGVLIVGSGNITHNLGEIDWDEHSKPMAWAVEFDEKIKEGLVQRNPDMVLDFAGIDSQLRRRALPTLEHYIPLAYAFGASSAEDLLTFPIEEFQNGSLSMRSVKFG